MAGSINACRLLPNKLDLQCSKIRPELVIYPLL